MYHHIIYKVITNPKLRYVRVADGKVWDNSTSTLETTPSSYANSAITLTRNSTINGIPITIPAALPAGDYDMLIYDAAAPANSDAVTIGRRIMWTGKVLIGLPIDILSI